MRQVIEFPSAGRRAIPWIGAALGWCLLLHASDLQPGFRVVAAARPSATASAGPTTDFICPISATMTAPEIAALARDIGRRFHVAQGAAHSIASAAYSAARLRGIDPALVLAVAAVESKFKPHAVNASTGATGLMQIVPKWHPQQVSGVGGEPSLLLIAPNITVGAAILADYVEAEDGNVTDALGHYLGTAGADRYVNRVRLEREHFAKVLKTI